MTTSIETPPPKPRFSSVRIEEDGDTLSLRFPAAHWGASIFLVLWLIGWTVGCVMLVGAVINQREPFLILFAVPFWVSWIFVAALVTNMWFGRHRMVLSSEGLAHEWHVIVRLSSRQIPLAELREFQVRVFNVDSEGGSTTGIEATTLGRSLTFGTNLSSLERTWLAHRLNQHLKQLRQQARIDAAVDDDLPDCRTCETPTDGAWVVNDDDSNLTFQQRGKFELGAILGLLFVNGFCNGIVGVFVAVLCGFAPGNQAPDGIGWWGMFLFLIPFEAIGLTLFGALVLALLEPYRVTRWTITSDEISQVTTRLGLPLGWKCRHQHDGIDGVAIRDDLNTSWNQSWPNNNSAAPTGEQYGLLITDGKNDEICSIKKLTLGEARWMKGRLQERGLLRSQ